ncbi:MAG: UDP-N-acetylmuramoyl-L-alanyl-D-glutamate--2,6-diaminopimelate ligase [Clostridia bacterium]|nr:UDP-N-acetylmuramoyl-L-alanyl-D-glutamate--2,6-diaminopimelate ligase [Clostridia bacterium]
MRLYDICRGANIECPPHLADAEIEGITSDSRRVKRNYLFFCLSGMRDDGHRYIRAALERGAYAAVIEDKRYACDRSITVESTRASLARAMNVLCGEPTKKLKFIGVTGTNGKTSVSVMIKHIFDSSKKDCEIIGTLNCSSFSEKSDDFAKNFTTPDPEELYPMLRRISDAGIEWVVMEASSHALKLHKLEPIDFEIGIFTNLTEDHLDFHGDMEDYFKSKLCLFDKCKLGIINIDGDYGKRILQSAKCSAKTCSLTEKADYFAESISYFGEHGTKYTIKTQAERINAFCRAPGAFSVMNSMQAIAAAIELGIDREDAERAIERFSGVRGRLERVPESDELGYDVFIDYAHTPDALEQLLIAVRNFKREGSRIILLFGCGGDREKEKRAKMGGIATELADITVITGDNPRSEDPQEIINDILQGIDKSKEYIVIQHRKNAIGYAMALAREGDVVLLAGKGHENYEINGRGRFHFDEREIIREIIDKKKQEE